MGRQERFLKWLVEQEKIKLSDLEKHGLIPMLVMVIGFYEKWRTTTECGKQPEWDSPYKPNKSNG